MPLDNTVPLHGPGFRVVQGWLPQRAAMTAGSDPRERDWSVCVLAIARERDVESFAELFGHFAPLLKGFFIRSGLPHGVAEDIAQEAMLAVWRKAGYFDPTRASAATWIFTIARNLRIDVKRKERGPPGERLHEDLHCPLPNERILLSQRDARIHAAVERLPRDQTEVIRLAFFEDWSQADIAAALNIPLGTVKSRVRLAMARLRKLIEDAE